VRLVADNARLEHVISRRLDKKNQATYGATANKLKRCCLKGTIVALLAKQDARASQIPQGDLQHTDNPSVLAERRRNQRESSNCPTPNAVTS
jgi:hypothetical protein